MSAGRAVVVSAVMLVSLVGAGRSTSFAGAGQAGAAVGKAAVSTEEPDHSMGFAMVDYDAMTLQAHRLEAVGATFNEAFGGVIFDEHTGELTVRYLDGTRGDALVAGVRSLPARPGEVPVRFAVVQTSLADMRAVADSLNDSRAWAGANAPLVHQVMLDELRLQILIDASGAAAELTAAVRATTGFTPHVDISEHGLVNQ